jgi:outer membrane receptor for Fe3+-dicitrate
MYIAKDNPDTLVNEITTFDHALTRPWKVVKNYRREKDVEWVEDLCSENNNHVTIGKEHYFMSADGYLMPAKKDQAPPDLRYFEPKQN